jgi:biotin transporter BioY
VAIIYLFGALWLAGWVNLFSPGGKLSAQVFTLGILPFIGVDLIKAFVATQIIFALGKKSSPDKA